MIRIYTTSWCGDCAVAKNVLRQRRVEFEEINIELDPDAARFVTSVNGGRRSVPTLEYAGDAISLSGFSRARLDAWLARHDLLAQPT